MRYAPRAILAAALGFAVSFVVACGGGSGLLSGDQSDALNSQADQVSSAVQSGNCGAAVNASVVLNGDVQTLPVTVNPTLRRNLSQGASTIAELARKDCRHHTTSTQSATTSSSTTTTSTSTSTSTSTTTPTTTTSTSTTSTSATTPTDTGSTSTTTGGVGLGGGTTTDNGTGNGSGGTGPGQGNNSGPGGGG
jgi:cytoskeletal protein RodZ